MRNKLIDLFIKLVQINSPSGNECELISFITAWAKKNHLIYQVDKLGNILVKNNKVSNPILFCSHMDTVQSGKNIKPIIYKNIIKSDGKTILGADNKAALACLLTTVEDYLQKEKNARSFELLFTVKEETGGGIEFFPFDWIQSKTCFIFDSAHPLGGIILRSPFIYNFHAEFFGKATHSSLPKKGKNALIPAIQALNKIHLGEKDYGKVTINIGLINGGTSINTIPNNCSVNGEIRSYDEKLLFKNLGEIESEFKLKAKRNKILIKYWKDGYSPGYTNSIYNSNIIRIKNIYKKFNLKTKYFNKSGVSDANILNAHGIETIVLTDGVISPHTCNEKIAINSLYKMTKIISAIIYNKW